MTLGRAQNIFMRANMNSVLSVTSFSIVFKMVLMRYEFVNKNPSV